VSFASRERFAHDGLASHTGIRHNLPMSRLANLRQNLATIVIAFLPAASVQAQDLPDGAGKELVMNVCSACHELGRITSKKRTKEEWSDTVDKMAKNGAKATDEEFDRIVAYLAKYFGKDEAAKNN
jgi:mono/diheme cytochrome c family protein